MSVSLSSADYYDFRQVHVHVSAWTSLGLYRDLTEIDTAISAHTMLVDITEQHRSSPRPFMYLGVLKMNTSQLMKDGNSRWMLQQSNLIIHIFIKLRDERW